MTILRKLGKIISEIEDWMAVISFLAMTGITMVIVVCRYILKVEFMAGEEIARYLMIWCAYVGVAYGFRKNSHVGVVVFAEMIPDKYQAYVLHLRRICTCLVVIAICIFAYEVMFQYLSTGQKTTVTKIPTAFVYSIVPISLTLSVVHTVVDLVVGFKPELREEVPR